jgi:hypothetical protein
MKAAARYGLSFAVPVFFNLRAANDTSVVHDDKH